MDVDYQVECGIVDVDDIKFQLTAEYDWHLCLLIVNVDHNVLYIFCLFAGLTNLLSLLIFKIIIIIIYSIISIIIWTGC